MTQHSGRVLVVDDDIPLGKVTARLLRSAGFEAEAVFSGAAALEASRGRGFDVIISDIIMPELDGLELMRKVRAFDLDVPVLLITGTPSIETARRAVELGAFRYHTKPVEREELVSTVRQAVFAHRMAKLKRQAFSVLGGSSQLPGDRAGLETALTDALDTLWMAYQPIVSTAGELIAYETLMRTPQGHILPHPGAVLDAAEHLGRLEELGRLVRRRCVPAMADATLGAQLFVNLHPNDLLDHDLLDRTAPLSALADRVVLELTERMSLDRIPEVQETVGELRDMGFRIAIDDLGSGYAGLTSFATLEPEIVKLDMSLVRDVDTSPTKAKLIGSMVALCKDLGIQVVAEGIETHAEREAVTELGVDLLQGYLISKPAPPFPDITRW